MSGNCSALDRGLIRGRYADGTTAESIISTFFVGKGVETLYVDAHADFEQGEHWLKPMRTHAVTVAWVFER